MTFSDGNIVVAVDDGVLNVFRHFRQVGRKLEKGGILLGQCYDNDSIVIKKASTPTKFDKSHRFNFFRDKRSAQLFIDYEFLNSNGKTIYLGEWHTHPEDYPTPSGTDVKMIKNQFNKNSINEDFLIMVIVGRKSFYVCYFDGKRIIQLNRSE